MKRTPERLAEIDAFIRKHYPGQGPTWIGEKLGEKPAYISNRIQNLGLKTGIPRPHGKKDKREKPSYRELEERNRTLRREMIRLITENRRLKKK